MQVKVQAWGNSLEDGVLLAKPSAAVELGLALVCPIISKVKGYPFEVLLPTGCPVQGVVLADQLRSLDWRSRQAERIAAAPVAVLEQALRLIATLSMANGGWPPPPRHLSPRAF